MNVDISSNVFKVPNPSEWWCRVSSFSSAHTTLRVDVIHQKGEKESHFSEILFLEFRKVAYFSGWMTWVGANFRIATDEEKLQLLQRSNLDLQKSSEQLLGPYEFGSLTLFMSESQDGKQIQILANAARNLNKDNVTLIEVP